MFMCTQCGGIFYGFELTKRICRDEETIFSLSRRLKSPHDVSRDCPNCGTSAFLKVVNEPDDEEQDYEEDYAV